MDVTKLVAVNAKRLREEKKLTLDAAAAATGVSRSMLAQIERGEVNPTISVLWKMANGYRVSFTALVEERGENAVSVLRQGEPSPLSEDGGRYLNYPLFSFDERTGFVTYRIVIRSGGALDAQPHLSGAEEYITVFSGSAEIRVGEAVYTLERGDSIRFRADVPHGYRNPGADTAELSMLIYYNRS